MNDTVDFSVNAMAGASATNYTLEWTCAAKLVTGITCPANTNAASLAWADVGNKQVIVKIKDDLNNIAYDTISVNVISDPPTVTIKSTTDTLRQKINSSLSLTVSASDKYGTVDSIAWGCSSGNVLAFDSSKAFSPAAASVTTTLGVTLPVQKPTLTSVSLRRTMTILNPPGTLSISM
jgi:hypothetical protein